MLKRILIFSILCTLAIEAACLIGRYGFDFQSTRDTASVIAPLTMGLRIHHGYMGVVLLFAVPVLGRRVASWAWILYAVAIALVASDLIHHFAVLWPIEGEHCFDLTYD